MPLKLVIRPESDHCLALSLTDSLFRIGTNILLIFLSTLKPEWLHFDSRIWNFNSRFKILIFTQVRSLPCLLKQFQILKRQVLFPVLEHFLGNVLKQGELFFLESQLYSLVFKSPQNIVQGIISLLISDGEDPVLPATCFNLNVMHFKQSR